MTIAFSREDALALSPEDTQRFREQLPKGGIQLFLYGFIEYRDIHAKPGAPPYRACFAFSRGRLARFMYVSNPDYWGYT